MIRVCRGRPPGDLAGVRKQKLRELRKIAATRVITGDDITGYRLDSVRRTLWAVQHRKCCYCEKKIELSYSDVEHYRPKARANRTPGSTDTYGYWWLAYTWKNLLYACSSCNRSEKNDRFPLTPGDTALIAGKHPPGEERPYLLDPATCNPVEHIQFRLDRVTRSWRAKARAGSAYGHWTIEVCGLNRDQGLIELRNDHVAQAVQPHVDALQQALSSDDGPLVSAAFKRALGLLQPACTFVALSYDALCHLVPTSQLAPWRLSWPTPARVGARR